jgi:nitroreductase
MNETIGFLRRRRSVPAAQLREPGPDAAELETILSIASRVPDHGKLAPWRFIVIEGEARHRLGETIARIFQADCPDAPEDKIAAERARLARAPLVVAVVSNAKPHPKIPEWEQLLSTGAVCMNLVTAANALGFGTAWITEWIAYDRRFLDTLGLAPDERLAGYIHIGRPAMVPTDRARPDLAQIVTRA